MTFLNTTFTFLVARPLVFMLLALLPFVLIAYWKRAFPTRLALLLLLLPVAISFLTIFVIGSIYVALVLDVILLVALLVDLQLIPRKKSFQVSREMAKVFSLGKPQNVELEITNSSNRNCRVEMIDDLPVEFDSDPPSFPLQLKTRSRKQCHARLTSSRRGLFHLAGIHVKVYSLLRLWRAYYFYPNRSVAHVYPDLKQISEFGLLARTNRLSLLGFRRTRKVGQDNEFERLRDYTRDDNQRHIDWRATARKRKLMVKDFQNNQNQSIIFLVDCGRMLTGISGKISMLDHAFNAMLLMSYVALKQGDSVGLLTFSNCVHRYTPPKTGTRHLNRLLHASFDQHPQYVESRYDEAFVYLNKHCRKRSLVILITNLIDQINANQVEKYLQNLTHRHLPMGVFLRDHDVYDPIDEYLELSVNDRNSNDPLVRQQLYEAAAASEIARWRHQSINMLTHSGVLMLDVFPEQLTSAIVNRYLEIKARHLL